MDVLSVIGVIPLTCTVFLTFMICFRVAFLLFHGLVLGKGGFLILFFNDCTFLRIWNIEKENIQLLSIDRSHVSATQQASKLSQASTSL